MPIYGNTVGGVATPNSYEIIGEDGTTLLAVATPSGKEEILTAQPQDIRAGKIAAISDGIVEGTNTIAYRTTTGVRLIRPGEVFSIPLSQFNRYDYTKFQCIIVKKNTSATDSVEANKVVINEQVFPVSSTNKISDVTKNSETKSIDLNISNTTETSFYIKYFTYKQE